MKKLWTIGLLLTLVGLSHADERKTFWCENGGKTVVTQGLNSTTKVQGSSPQCLVTVFVTGTANKAIIYSDNSRSVLSNPFHAQTNGQFSFYALDGRYDVTICANNTGNPNTCGTDTILPAPITFSDILFCDPATGCGGGSGAPHNFLSATHLDTVPYTPPVAGDTVYSLPTPGKWEKLAGNATTTPMWMKSVGNGSVVTAQGWSIVGGACSAGQFISTLAPDLTIVCATPSFNPLVSVAHNGTDVGARPRLNLIDGGNLTWTISDNVGTNSIDITQNVTGAGTGCITPGHAGDVLFDSGTGCTEFDTVYGGDENLHIDRATNAANNFASFTTGILAPSYYFNLKSTFGRGANWIIDNPNDTTGLSSAFDIEADQSKNNNQLYGIRDIIGGPGGITGAGVVGMLIQNTGVSDYEVENGLIITNFGGNPAASPSSLSTGLWIQPSICSDGQSGPCAGGNNKNYAFVTDQGKSYFGGDIILQPEATVTPNGGANSAPMGQVACTAAQRGRIHYVNSGAGIADIPEICAKDASGVYSWRPMFGQSSIAGVNEMTFSATPTFNYTLGPVKAMLLTGNITSSSATNAVDGGSLTVVLCQDGTGNRTVTWPTNFYNFPTVNPLANSCTTTYAVYRSSTSTWYATSSSTGGGGGGSSLTWLGTWSAATNYVINNAVLYNGSSYVALIANTGVTPGSDGGTTWQLIAQAGTAGINGTNGTNGSNGAPGAPGYSPNQIISGCGISYSGTGFTFTVQACTYLVNNVTYSAPMTTVTGTAADPTLDRTDAIVANACSPLPCTGTISIIAGTASATPAPPTIDISSQTQLTFYDISAAATAPSNIVLTDIYHENAEWTCVASANVNCASTNFPHSGTKDIEFTTATTGNNVKLTIPAGSFDIGTRDSLPIYFRSKAPFVSTRSLTLQWYNGNTPKCTPVSLKDGNFGLNTAITSGYQLISIPTSVFGCSGIPITNLRVTVAGTGTTVGFFLDDIVLQGGIVSPAGSASMVWKGNWSSTTAYSVNDVVFYGNTGSSYIAVQANTNLIPSTAPLSWSVLDTHAPAGVAGNLQVANGAAFTSLNTSISGSNITFPGIVYATQFQSTDTVNNTEITFLTGSSGDATCPTPVAGSSFLCNQSNVLNVSQNGAAYAPIGTGSGTVTSVSGTSPISSSGGATPAISCPTCAIGPGSSTANHLAKFSGTDGLTLADGGAIPTGTVTSVATTSPISGGTITGTGTVSCPTCTTNAAALTSGQLVVGGGSQAAAVGNLSGAVTTSGSTATTLAARYTIRDCEVVIGDPGAASPVLANDNDSPAVCGNDYGADYTISAVACYADAGSPTITPILTGGSATSVLSGALTCGTAAWAAGTVNGTPTVHTFNSDGATCASTPCTVDANITSAGGTAKYIVVRIKMVIAAP